MARRALIVVLDGFGVGAMSDVSSSRPDDRGANSLEHTLRAERALRLPVMGRLGLVHLVAGDLAPQLAPAEGFPASPEGAWGRNRLGYSGADSYVGHQVIMGSDLRRVELRLFREVLGVAEAALKQHGFHVGTLPDHPEVLLVQGHVVVADNIEADPGQVYNVTASLEEVSFDEVERVARVIRENLRVSRVIAVGGHDISLREIQAHVRRLPSGQVGVDTPGLGIYREGVQLRHYGFPLDVRGQVATRAHESGLPVTLVGKAADLIQCDGAQRHPAVETEDVRHWLLAALESQSSGLIVANVQELDLAGHEENVARYGAVLEACDRLVGDILTRLTPEDLLVVTGDHGDDPCIGHSRHTREMTPLLVWTPDMEPVGLGERPTLADVGATVADWLGVGPTETGTSFLAELRRQGSA